MMDRCITPAIFANLLVRFMANCCTELPLPAFYITLVYQWAIIHTERLRNVRRVMDPLSVRVRNTVQTVNFR